MEMLWLIVGGGGGGMSIIRPVSRYDGRHHHHQPDYLHTDDDIDTLPPLTYAKDQYLILPPTVRLPPQRLP